MDAVTSVPSPVNEPIRMYAPGSPERASLEARLAELARAGDCEAIRLDSGVVRSRAHRFYFRRGYAIESFNFGRRLRAERGD